MFQENKNRKRIETLEDDLQKLQRDLLSLKLEWTDTLGRLLKMAGRATKQAALAQEREDAMMGKDALTEEDRARQLAFPGFTPKQAEAQARILARRAGRKVNGEE
jgi:hypothetical protein